MLNSNCWLSFFLTVSFQETNTVTTPFLEIYLRILLKYVKSFTYLTTRINLVGGINKTFLCSNTRFSAIVINLILFQVSPI